MKPQPDGSPASKPRSAAKRERLEGHSAPSIGALFCFCGDMHSARAHLKNSARATVRRLLDAKNPQQAATRPATSKLPESAVLAQLRSFLPQMQSANEQLAQRGDWASAVTIEDAQDDHAAEEQEEELAAAQHVQMDIACGVVDLKDQAALRAAQNMVHGLQQAEQSDSSSSSDRDSYTAGDTPTDSDTDDAICNNISNDTSGSGKTTPQRLTHRKRTCTDRDKSAFGCTDDTLKPQIKRQHKKIIEMS